MAARHFASTGSGEDELDSFPYEDDFEGTMQIMLAGKHFRAPDVAFVPTVTVETGVESVAEDEDADDRARAYVEALLREVDAAMQEERMAAIAAAQEAEREAQHRAEMAAITAHAGKHWAMPEPLEQPVQSAEPVQEPVSDQEPTPDTEPPVEPAVAQDDGDNTATEGSGDALVAGLPDIELDEPMSLAEKSQPVEDEPTLQLDRRVLIEKERGAERLEVSTELPPEPAATPAAALVPAKSNSGFFARIGAFFARLFRLDDRR